MSIRSKSAGIGSVLVGALMLCSAANATLIGDTVMLSTTHDTYGPTPSPSAPSAVVVDPGAEFDVFNNGNVILDIGSEVIHLDIANGPYCGWLTCTPGEFFHIMLTDLDWVGMSGVITDAQITTSNLSMGTVFVSFTDDSVTIDIGEQSLPNGRVLTIELTASHDVPEPGTLALFGLGLAGLGFARRRKAA